MNLTHMLTLVALVQIGPSLILPVTFVKLHHCFLESYEPLNEIPFVHCGTVWINPITMQEYLLVRDQMLRFGNLLPHSLINPNHMVSMSMMIQLTPQMPLVSQVTWSSSLSTPQGQWCISSQEYPMIGR